MAKHLEDIEIRGWNGVDNCLLSKFITKEMTVPDFFKNLTTKSYQCGFNAEKSSFYGPWVTQSPIIDQLSIYNAIFCSKK